MAFTARQSISIVFPAYNEEGNIAKAVEQATNFLGDLFRDWEIIVVNDGSKDGTGEILNKLSFHDNRVIPLHHESNKGYGAALRSGITKAQKDLIFFCDSDLQFHLNELLLLLSWIEQYDIVAGYRAKRTDPFHRKLNAMGWKALVRLLLGLKVRDIDCAFKLFKRDVFREIRIDAVGAMVNTDILVQATRMGFAIKEVPVTHFPRINGKQTGANIKVVLRAFKELLRLYSKLRNVSPIFIPYDRRKEKKNTKFINKRGAERRKVSLPINFSDRRVRLFKTNGNGTEASPIDYSYSNTYNNSYNTKVSHER